MDVGDEVASTSITESGRYILSGGEDGGVRGWKLGSKDPMLVNHLDGRIVFLSYLSGDNSFVAVDKSGRVTKYAWPEGATASTMKTRDRPRHVALSAGRRFLAVVTHDETVELIDLQSEQRMGTIEIEKDLDDIVFAGFDRTGRQLVVISNQGEALSWNPSTRRLLRTMELGGESLSGSESKIKTASARRTTNAFVAGVEEVALPKGGVTDRRARPGQLVRRDWIISYDLETGVKTGRFQFPKGSIEALAYGPGNKYAVAVGSEAEEELSIVDLQTSKVVNTVSVGSDVSSVSVSEKGKWLVAGAADGMVLVKELSTESPQTALSGDAPALEPERASDPPPTPADEKDASRQTADQSSRPEAKSPEKSEEEDVSSRPPIDTQIPETEMTRPNDIAVVVGTKNYRDQDVPDVDYALRDARVMKKYLTRTLGFREENVIFEKDASGSTLKRLFGTSSDSEGQVHDWVRPDESDVFVYYSGHGAPDPETGEAYLVASDTDPNYLTLNGYPLNQLYENLATLPAESVTVVLEACFSGVSEEGAVVQDVSSTVLSVENPVMAMENGLAFTAGAADQVGSWHNEKRHGLFTYYFLKGLKGAANQNDDQAVTAREMKAYLTDKVPYRAQRMHSRTQTPQVVGQNLDRLLVQYEDR